MEKFYQKPSIINGWELESTIIIMKAVLVALLFAVALTITDKEIIQQALNGAFEQNKLPQPTTIVKCIDDTSAHQIVVFGGQVLDKAAKGSISDLIALPKLIKDFGENLDPKVGECLDGNAEFEALGVKYNPKNESSDAIEKKVITYVTLHYLTVHKWLGDLDDTWHAGNYYQVGFKGATYGHNILGLVQETEFKLFKSFAHNHIEKIIKEISHLRAEYKL